MEKKENVAYKVLIEKSAQKQIGKIERRFAEKIMSAIARLSLDPRPMGYTKLKGRNAFRIRVGDYRVIYEIQDAKLVILIVEVGHRREVYRK